MKMGKTKKNTNKTTASLNETSSVLLPTNEKSVIIADVNNNVEKDNSTQKDKKEIEQKETVSKNYEHVFVAYAINDIYGVTIKEIKDNNICKEIILQPTFGNTVALVTSSSSQKQVSFEHILNKSVLVLTRMCYLSSEIKDWFDLHPDTNLSLHILVENDEDALRYETIKPENIFAFLPRFHHKAFAVNKSSPRYLEFFRNIWNTYFAFLFPKEVSKKRISESEGLRVCVFKPNTNIDDWCTAMQCIFKYDTNIMENMLLKTGLFFIDHFDSQAEALIYGNRSTPLILTSSEDINDKTTATILYNSDVDPVYIARAFNKRLSLDVEFNKKYKNNDVFTLTYIGCYKCSMESFNIEIFVVPLETDIGKRRWREFSFLEKQYIQQQITNSACLELESRENIMDGYNNYDECCIYCSYSFEPVEFFKKHETKQ